MGTYLIKDLNDFVAKSVHDVHNVFRLVNTGGKKRRAAYVLHLGKRANLSSAAGELMRCLRGVLRPGEYLDTANDCFTIAGPTFRITYVLEGTGKQPMFTVIASQGVHDDVFETICSFGNGLGGDILLGVNDDGVVVGMSEEAIESSKRDVKRFCSAKGLFSAPVRVGVAEHIVNGHRVLHIRVPKAPAKLQYKGVAYIRRGDADYKA